MLSQVLQTLRTTPKIFLRRVPTADRSWQFLKNLYLRSPKEPDQDNAFIEEKNSTDANLFGTPNSNEQHEVSSESPLADNFEELLDAREDTLPDLISPEPEAISEPVHAKIKNITYTQYLGSTYGGKDSKRPYSKASSGYQALNNGLISIEIPHANAEKKAALISKMHDQSLCEALFAREDSTWRSSIIKRRIENTLKRFLEDELVLALSGMQEVNYREIKTTDFYLLHTRKALAAIKDDIVDPQRAEIDLLARLIPGAAQTIAHNHAHKAGAFSIAPQELYDALEQEAKNTKIQMSIPFERRLLKNYLADLPTLSCELKAGNNHNELHVAGQRVYTQEYGPTNSAYALNGSWPTSPELEELAEREFKNPSSHLASLKGKHIPVLFLAFTQEDPYEEQWANAYELKFLRTQLEKKPTELTVLFLIAFEKEWTSCLFTKFHETTTFTVTDPHNKDRSTEKGMISLAEAIQEALTKKASPDKKKPDILKDLMVAKEPEADAQKAPGVNYDAPYANLRDEDLPSLEDLFGDKIPNTVTVTINQLKKKALKGSVGDKLKNSLMLYGPPGTGKSTIAQVIARLAKKISSMRAEVTLETPTKDLVKRNLMPFLQKRRNGATVLFLSMKSMVRPAVYSPITVPKKITGLSSRL